MSEISSQSLLAQMQHLSDQARGLEQSPTPLPGQSFGNVLEAMIGSVNDAKQESRQLAVAFDSGDESVSLPQVMVASQKSRVYFETTLQVRNKMLSAYQELMNMPL